jgi:hypothetical protein
MNIIDMIANDLNVSPALSGALRKSGAADHYDCELIRHSDDPKVVVYAFVRLWKRKFPEAKIEIHSILQPQRAEENGSIHDRGSERSREVRDEESGPDVGWDDSADERAAAERMGGV